MDWHVIGLSIEIGIHMIRKRRTMGEASYEHGKFPGCGMIDEVPQLLKARHQQLEKLELVEFMII